MQQPKVIKQAFQVSITFDLLFTSHVFQVENKTLLEVIKRENQKTKAFVVIDSGVVTAHPSIIENIQHYFKSYSTYLLLVGNPLEIPGGEHAKNDASYINTILENVNTHAIDRHSYIIAIGGGAVLDAVGYAAAIAHRGVRLVRIPTTILSQNDSGIGVKNGINFFNKKNFVGTFAAPYAVINDDAFLTTLNDRDWRSGISEAIKVALIKDYAFFEWIEAHANELNLRDRDTMNALIFKCADMHLKHIQHSGDAFEQGSSRPLDFGHWAAHKLEQISKFEIRHGEAVAMGIALDSTYSYLKGYIGQNDLNRILNVIINLGFTITFNIEAENLINGLEEFREHLGGTLTIMLLKALGEGFEVNHMDTHLVGNAINYLNTYSKSLY